MHRSAPWDLKNFQKLCIEEDTLKENECDTFGHFRCKMAKGVTFIFLKCTLSGPQTILVLSVEVEIPFSKICYLRVLSNTIYADSPLHGVSLQRVIPKCIYGDIEDLGTFHDVSQIILHSSDSVVSCINPKKPGGWGVESRLRSFDRLPF